MNKLVSLSVSEYWRHEGSIAGVGHVQARREAFHSNSTRRRSGEARLGRHGISRSAVEIEGSAEGRNDVGATGPEEAGGGKKSGCRGGRLVDGRG